jgi:hypothetical protein
MGGRNEGLLLPDSPNEKAGLRTGLREELGGTLELVGSSLSYLKILVGVDRE